MGEDDLNLWRLQGRFYKGFGFLKEDLKIKLEFVRNSSPWGELRRERQDAQ